MLKVHTYTIVLMKKYITLLVSPLLLAGICAFGLQTVSAEEVAVPTLYTTVVTSSDSESSPTTRCTALTYTLKLGSKDRYTKNEVTKLQSFLISQRLLTGTPTGYFGNATRDAVKKFQVNNGLTAIGSVGPQTRVLIKNISSCSSHSEGGSTTDNGTSGNTVIDSRCIGSVGYTKCEPSTCPAPGVLINGVCTNNGDATVAPLSGKVEVVSPSSPLALTVGDTLTIAWLASQSKTATTTLIISLQGTSSSIIKYMQPTTNVQGGTYSWVIPEHIAYGDIVGALVSGKYTIKATLYEGVVSCLGFCMDSSNKKVITSDESDMFIIQSKTEASDTKNISIGIPSSPTVLGVSVMCTDLPRNLHRGMESVTVSFLQSFLLEKGFLEGEATGFYG
ncbi:MAG: hypothetical protein RLZZ308_33, partial [Candidatus Parcubacteria bacterium]